MSDSSDVDGGYGSVGSEVDTESPVSDVANECISNGMGSLSGTGINDPSSEVNPNG